MSLSPKAKLLAANPSLKAKYLLDPESDPVALSEQFSQLSKEAELMSSSNTQRCIDKMLPIVGFFENGRFVAVAKCDEDGCNRETRWSAENMPRPDVVFTKIRNRKWQVSRKKITCDQCVKRKRNPPKAHFHREAPPPPLKPIAAALADAVEERQIHPSREAAAPIIAEVETIMPQDTIAPTDKAKAAKRHAYSLLLEHYNEDHKRYEGDWSDIKIAALVGMSEAFVAKIREDDFGPAGPPPQLIDLKQRITALETKLGQKEQMVLRAMDEIPQMQEEVKLLGSQLQALISAHGWAS